MNVQVHYPDLSLSRRKAPSSWRETGASIVIGGDGPRDPVKIWPAPDWRELVDPPITAEEIDAYIEKGRAEMRGQMEQELQAAAEREHNAWKAGFDAAYQNLEEERLERIKALGNLVSSAFHLHESLKELAAEPQFAKPIDGFKPMDTKENRFYREAPVATVTPRTAMDRPRTAQALTSMATAAAKQLAPKTPSSGHGKAGKAILDNLAQWKAWGFPGVTIEQLALLTEYHPRTPGRRRPTTSARPR